MMMSILHDARMRVSAVLQEIERLKQGEFPYDYPCNALVIIENRFKWHQSTLQKASESTPRDIIHNVCRESLRELSVYLPILGFLLRSTNVRNAFESYDPLQRLTNKVMGTDAKLIISSEWEISPFVYRHSTGPLCGFVLIGIPAPESSNPLLLPLAGHELGHSVWLHERFSEKYAKSIEEGIQNELLNNKWNDFIAINKQYSKEDIKSGNMFARQALLPAYTWAMLQVEEMFCDFFGIRLFAESFYYAFAYLLSPGISGQRSAIHPNIKRRVSHHVQAAKVMGINVGVEYESFFEKEIESTNPSTALLLSLADEVSASFADELINFAKDFANQKSVPERNHENVENICKHFHNYVVPIKNYASLADIINAGWKCNMNENLWDGISQIKGVDEKDTRRNRDRILRDIILKSMEIAEINERLERLT